MGCFSCSLVSSHRSSSWFLSFTSPTNHILWAPDVACPPRLYRSTELWAFVPSPHPVFGNWAMVSDQLAPFVSKSVFGILVWMWLLTVWYQGLVVMDLCYQMIHQLTSHIHITTSHFSGTVLPHISLSVTDTRCYKSKHSPWHDFIPVSLHIDTLPCNTSKDDLLEALMQLLSWVWTGVHNYVYMTECVWVSYNYAWFRKGATIVKLTCLWFHFNCHYALTASSFR